MKNKVLKDYLEYKKTSVKSKEKLKDLERYVGKFLNSFKQDVSKCEEKDLIKFINSLEGKFKISSQNDIKAYLKNFIKWYFEDYPKRFRNLDKLCRTQKPDKTYEAEDMLSLKEVERLIKGEKDLMWRVYWLVFFYGCFRPSEAVAISNKQISYEKKGVIIKSFSKKNKKTFYKSLPSNAEQYLKEWQKKNKSDWLFPSPLIEGEHIKPKSVYFRLIRLSKRVLGKQINPYLLRHSIATIKYNEDGIEDKDVANQMGHSKSMRETYVHLDDEKLKARARKVWAKAKPLKPEERNKLELLEKEVKGFKKDNEILTKLFNDVLEDINRKLKKQNEKIKKLRGEN